MNKDLKALIVDKMPTQTETGVRDGATAGKSERLTSGDAPHGSSADGRESCEECGRENSIQAISL